MHVHMFRAQGSIDARVCVWGGGGVSRMTTCGCDLMNGDPVSCQSPYPLGRDISLVAV